MDGHPVDGVVGGEATQVMWTRPTADPSEDPALPLTIGPLPNTEGRLQFKVLQTYADGTVDAWIQDWPAGAEEPERPGPVIDLVTGAPGTVPSSTIATTTTAAGAVDTIVATSRPAAPTTTEPPTSELPSSRTSTPPPPVTTSTSNDDSNAAVLGVVLALVAAVVAIGVMLIRRNRR